VNEWGGGGGRGVRRRRRRRRRRSEVPNELSISSLLTARRNVESFSKPS